MELVWPIVLLVLGLIVGFALGRSGKGGRPAGPRDENDTVEHAAHARLSALDRKLRSVMDHLGVPDPEPALQDVLRFLEQGKKVQAVKAYRDATGADLHSATQAVDEIARENGL
ncbi:hypothetical protein [Allorhizocola rhizosphaerae]|uniref:hypothetical protein n=1 Tax=Allorhizocola rhizosphaerae TaxID=1872709 RepID=UPI000E3DC7B8|nr:hypothetical protein [Allorhizocola rhizosphaerae]